LFKIEIYSVGQGVQEAVRQMSLPGGLLESQAAKSGLDGELYLGQVYDQTIYIDQAIAHSAGVVAAQGVRTMLGLADRARVIDLFAQVMAGDISAALAEMKDQYDIGASPSVVLTDLAEFVHFVTRLKYVPVTAQDRSLTETERLRGVEFSGKLSVRALDRAWKILLRGIAEVESSERPLAAADMVLVRLAHAANLPFPEDLLRKLVTGSAEGGIGVQAPPGADRGFGAVANAIGPVSAGPAHAAPAPQLPETMRMQAPRAMAGVGGSPLAQPAGQSVEPGLELGRFEDLVLLAEEKREIRLRTMLRTNVRLISFRDGRMEFAIAGNPPPNFVSDIGQKLFQWTGRRWTITVSREGGGPTLDEQEKAELGERTHMARTDPVVEAVLARFPGSRIVDIKMREELALPAHDNASPELPGEGAEDQPG
jgi:DNA polymerase-3 subunit gamma/tau